MSNNQIVDLIHKLHHIWNTAEVDLIPTVYSENFVAHWPKGWGVGDAHGHTGIRQSILRTFEIFPDWHEELLDTIVADEKIVTRYHSTGTQMGNYMGESGSGKRIEFTEISIFRIEQEKVAEQWALADDLHCMAQMTQVEK